jgi:hypothetical protein
LTLLLDGIPGLELRCPPFIAMEGDILESYQTTEDTYLNVIEKDPRT